MTNNSKIHIIDLNFLQNEQTIAAFLIETDNQLALVESGPYSTHHNLCTHINELGFSISDVKHVFLTHIHFDHAGAAWAWAERGAKIYVHPVGAPHLRQPQKLVESATRIYGDRMDELWGDMKPIDESLVIEAAHGEMYGSGELLLRAWHTPGHANHHIAWQLNEHLFCGDVAGIKINQGPVMPPCPPPDIHIGKWTNSLKIIRQIGDVRKLYLTHFGIVDDMIDSHLDELEANLLDWAKWVKNGMENNNNIEKMIPLFEKYVSDELHKMGVNDNEVKKYENANPAYMSVSGLVRYWKKYGSS